MFSVAVKTLVVLVPLLVSIAFITLAERKALGLHTEVNLEDLGFQTWISNP